LPFPTLESKKGIKPITPDAIIKTKYLLSDTKVYMDVITSDIDSMTYYANKYIETIEKNNLMEVHHHSHGGNYWKQYLKEFLMLFLAVFVSFLAESYLDFRTERHKEKDYLITLKNDLQSDTTNINFSLRNSDSLTIYSKRLSYLVYNYNKSIESQIQLYDCGIHIVTNLIDVPFSQGTLNQLKNSGGLRLIRNKDIVNAITDYDNAIQIIQRQFSAVMERLSEVHNSEKSIFYHAFWKQHPRSRAVEIDTASIIKSFQIRGTALLDDKQQQLIQLDNAENLHLGYVAFYNNMCLKQKERAEKLLKLIEKEN